MTPGTRRVSLLGFLLLTPSVAHAGSPLWTARLEAGSAQYSSHGFNSYGDFTSELSLDSGYSYSLAAEYRPTPHVGLELSIGAVNLDASWRELRIVPVSFNPLVLGQVTIASDTGTLALRPLNLGLLIHPVLRDRFDFYVGPQIGRTDFHLGLQGPPKRDPEWTIGGKAGFEGRIPRSAWSAGLVYRFLDTQHEGIEHDSYGGLGIHLLSVVVSYGRVSPSR
jgi:hypothetical protein